MPLDFHAQLRWAMMRVGRASACLVFVIAAVAEVKRRQAALHEIQGKKLVLLDRPDGPKILRTLFAPDSLQRNWRGWPAAPARILSCDHRLRGAGDRAGQSACARGRGETAH